MANHRTVPVSRTQPLGKGRPRRPATTYRAIARVQRRRWEAAWSRTALGLLFGLELSSVFLAATTLGLPELTALGAQLPTNVGAWLAGAALALGYAATDRSWKAREAERVASTASERTEAIGRMRFYDGVVLLVSLELMAAATFALTVAIARAEGRAPALLGFLLMIGATPLLCDSGSLRHDDLADFSPELRAERRRRLREAMAQWPRTANRRIWDVVQQLALAVLAALVLVPAAGGRPAYGLVVLAVVIAGMGARYLSELLMRALADRQLLLAGITTALLVGCVAGFGYAAVAQLQGWGAWAALGAALAFTCLPHVAQIRRPPSLLSDPPTTVSPSTPVARADRPGWRTPWVHESFARWLGREHERIAR